MTAFAFWFLTEYWKSGVFRKCRHAWSITLHPSGGNLWRHLKYLMRSKKIWAGPVAQKTATPPPEQLVVTDTHSEKITQQLDWCSKAGRMQTSTRSTVWPLVYNSPVRINGKTTRGRATCV